MHTAALGALIDERRVLLVHRRTDERADPGVWDLPGGLVEHGESDVASLARELQEELGVQIATGTARRLCRQIVRPAGKPVLLSAWLVGDWHGAPENLAPEEHDGLAWFSLEELPPPPHIIVRAALVEALRNQRG
ncbi:NUDIX domain-containing protein [Nocardioides sp. TF02-7]|uniref:NUDIX hydrolase n=1 Tax=Nocardioides sp. TF02-7 TaxID=2917724 RepID=UPI001F051276|nr:NUDIX domain-containing protein [Nocardioides sp. TF02-7]UMG91106.1 NUDIX domain-containing protein [Nocardioides sp. TF02-7]